jgi:hypothetical protein
VNKKQELAKYLEEMIAESLDWRPAFTLPGLPHYLKLSFQIWSGRLIGTDCLFLFSKDSDDVAVPSLEKQLTALRSKIQYAVVFVFDSLSSRTAQRLVKRRIPFVVIGRQIYLPFLLVKLQLERNQPTHQVPRKPLSPAAESLLIGQLLDARFEGMSGAQIAPILKDSAMTASKAIRELVDRRLCKFKIVGRKKLLTFGDRLPLWESAKTTLRNPIQTIAYSKSKPKIHWVYSGISSLSKTSLLSDDRIQTIAVYRRDFRQLADDHASNQSEEEGSSYKVEIWNRKPWLFSQENSIDPISLFLSLRSDPDERVQIELERIMKKIDLPI